MIKKFKDFCLERVDEYHSYEEVKIDGISTKDSFLQIIKKLVEEGKSEYVIYTYLYSLGIEKELVEYSMNKFKMQYNK